ncbi:Late embryogenesis abundant protein [Sesamum alatum]|uniref:Late embryogenesis abundant protein n=1 Tax=Sesamum alatum TaxID=300844 RepID=A0AAE1YJJ4_9LAMI|nr:Late embryogenesis abundant protein [Sesamum alatum]
MAEKHQHDREYGAGAQSRELRRKKRNKCLLYIFLFIVFQTAVILLFALTIMKIRAPKFRLSAAAFDTFEYSSAAANPSFNIRMTAQLSVKNTNFGQFKFEDTNIAFYYNGAVVGSAFIPGSRAKARSTNKFITVVELSSAGLQNRAQLGSDLSSGVLAVNSGGRLSGKVELLKVLKRKKSAQMNCIIAINLAQRIIGDLRCN